MSNQRFDASYRRLFGEGIATGDAESDRFFEAFYRRFLEHPDIAELFRDTDMARQVVMLRKSFFHLAGFYVTHSPSGEMERMARIHEQLGVGQIDYDRWLDCLVDTVAEFDPDCDEATQLAWRLALTPGITFMKLYEHFRSQPAS